MPSLTKRTIDGLKPQDKEYFVWDSGVSGFGLRVAKTGRKTYVIQYRKGKRTRRMTLAPVGHLTPDEARNLAKEQLGLVAKGNNPAESRRLHRIAPTMAGLCDRVLKEHAEERCKPNTQREYRHSIKNYIKPKLGTHIVQDVTRADIAALHHSMRDKPYQANRTLGVLSKMFNLAEIWGLRPDGSNPCRHVPKNKERMRERFLSDDELSRLGETLSECQYTGLESSYVIAAFRLLILTGCRLGEIQTLKWDYIWDDYIVLPDSKTGPRRIPLSTEGKAILASLTREEDNPYVIVGHVPGGHATDLQRPWRRIRKLAGIEDVRIHDLRHNFASRAVMSGMNLVLVGKLLGHTQIQTTMRYAHLADGPVKEAAEEISGSLTNSMGRWSPKPPRLRFVGKVAAE